MENVPESDLHEWIFLIQPGAHLHRLQHGAHEAHCWCKSVKLHFVPLKQPHAGVYGPCSTVGVGAAASLVRS